MIARSLAMQILREPGGRELLCCLAAAPPATLLLVSRALRPVGSNVEAVNFVDEAACYCAMVCGSGPSPAPQPPNTQPVPPPNGGGGGQVTPAGATTCEEVLRQTFCTEVSPGVGWDVIIKVLSSIDANQNSPIGKIWKAMEDAKVMFGALCAKAGALDTTEKQQACAVMNAIVSAYDTGGSVVQAAVDGVAGGLIGKLKATIPLCC